MCWVAAIPLAIGALSGAMQGQQQSAQAASQAGALRQNAVYLGNAAADARARGLQESDLARLQTQQLIGTQRAAAAASGGVVGQDSFGIIEQDTAQLGELDALTISNNAAREAYGYEVERSEALTTAKNLTSQARKGMLTSVLGGALQGFGSSGGGGFFASAGSGAGAGTRAALSGGTSRLNYNQAFA